ncbi:LytTR family transcriptional regulator [Chryseobacterium indologenes]|uniref:LytR/AlgR family response regulator transcription factor n=1 Tax=Chryseobacterium indologenes TaxID=253 RepID=UPI001109A1B8|nr:LytTR family DNA-binding domain-containing protein [Chryseobacterium indologenes]TLX27293.1 LytTR family transcriptional regulator [Chryseobacterium indologenes]
MFSFTTFPYPKSGSIKEMLLSSLAAGISVYLFLIIFQPFGTENFHHPYKLALLFPYTVIFGMAFLIMSLSTSKFNNWNLGAELLKITGTLITGSVFSYFYNSLFLSHVALSFGNYFYMLLYSLAVGIPVSTIYILSRYIYLKNFYENTAKTISQHLAGKQNVLQSDSLTISAGTTKLVIDEKDFLYVQSMENYCVFYCLENNQPKKHILRISLSKVLPQIETQSIQKCHRSYIVNLGKVKNLKGNAQGYKLYIPDIGFEVPVSRSFIPTVIPRLKQSDS